MCGSIMIKSSHISASFQVDSIFEKHPKEAKNIFAEIQYL